MPTESSHEVPLKRPGSWSLVVRRVLGPGTASRALFMLVGSSAAAQLIAVLASPILSRLYTPESFGALAVAASVVAILSSAGGLKYEVAVLLPRETKEAVALVWCAGIAIIAIACVQSAIIVLTGTHIARATGVADFERYVPWVVLGAVGAMTYQLGSYWALRQERMTLIARTRIRQATVTGGIQLGGGLLSAPAGLVVGYAIGRGVGGLSLLRSTWTGLRQSAGQISLEDMWNAAKRYRKFPLIAAGSGVLNSAGIVATPLLLAALYGPTPAGFYALAQRVVIAPIALLGEAARDVYLRQAAGRAQDSPHRLKGLFTRVSLRLALTGALPFAIIFFGAPPLFSIVFGSVWLEAGHYARLLAPMAFAQFVVVPLSQTLNVLERQGMQLLWDIGRLGTTVGIFLVGSASGASARTAIGWYGAGLVLWYAILFAAIFVVVDSPARLSRD
jgi:O-antigen/teichoic acid export membrane protein